MANDFDESLDESMDDSDDTEVVVKPEKSKLDARRRLEEYMEMKKLRELTDY